MQRSTRKAPPVCPLNCFPARHCVFTIDERLRHFFLEDRPLLGCLFQAVRSVVLLLFRKLNKSKNFVPGFICVLHTFGRSLQWNPHIHCLITEGGFSDDSFWRNVKHFSYTFLRSAFQTALLNEMEKRIGPSFKKTKALIYRKDKTVSMSMPNLTFAIHALSLNTLAVTS